MRSFSSVWLSKGELGHRMNEPLFLTLAEVLQFHADQIELAGGDAGILDIGKMESAIAQPRMMWQGKFLHEDLAAMAAAYPFHIVQNHGFADGNKRTGMNAAIVFLELNGYGLSPFSLRNSHSPPIPSPPAPHSPIIPS